MAFLGIGKKKGPLDAVTTISVFPRIGSAVLKVDTKLVVFSPAYLLGKHGAGTQEVASKFLDLRTATQLLTALLAYITPAKLTGDRIEVREVDVGMDCGYDALVTLTPELVGHVRQENVRGAMVNIIYTDKGKIPRTTLMNFILVRFDPKYGQGVDVLFKEKYGGNIGFENAEAVYAVLTMFPGKYAPPVADTKFWSQHALLKEI